jgi:ATP-dependent Clp protease protease subunit
MFRHLPSPRPLPLVAHEDDEPDHDPEEPVPDPKPDQPAKPEDARPGIEERLLKARTIQLTGGVDDKLAARVVSELLLLEADDAEKPITLFLNSPGGSVTAGFAIFDVMRFIQPPVRVVCAGLAASIATVILLGARKEHRLSLPNTRLLIHQPLIPGTVYGPASDLEITANELLKTRAHINRLLAEECGQPLERIEADTQRDYWLTAEEAKAYGLITRIVRHRAELAG